MMLCCLNVASLSFLVIRYAETSTSPPLALIEAQAAKGTSGLIFILCPTGIALVIISIFCCSCFRVAEQDDCFGGEITRIRLLLCARGGYQCGCSGGVDDFAFRGSVVVADEVKENPSFFLS